MPGMPQQKWEVDGARWALREYSKTNPESVAAFVRDHPQLSGLSTREAMKFIMRRRGSLANAVEH